VVLLFWKRRSFFLQIPLEVAEAGLPERAVPLDPAGDLLKRPRLKLVMSLAAQPLFRDEASAPQHPQMLGDGRTTLSKLGGERIHGRRTGAQPIEDRPARGVCDGTEHVGL